MLHNGINRMKILYNDREELNGAHIRSVNAINAKAVSFKYRDKSVFENISFSVRKGEKVAITGANGSGKLTRTLILCGLLKEYQGSIQINSKELNEISPNAWRNCFAFVTQEPYLSEGGVIENIRLGNLAATDDDVLEVMEKLDIAYLAERMVTFNEQSLSGGEKQRISIARALIKNTDMLIFDEPSNNFDLKTIEWISHFIKKCTQTVIYISHDTALIEKSDKLIHLSGIG